MPTYRSRRSYFTSPEYKVKSQRQLREQQYPSSQGFQSNLANYIPPFGSREGCNKNNRVQKENKSNKKACKKDADTNYNSLTRYGRTLSPPSSPPSSSSDESFSDGDFSDDSTASSMNRGAERGSPRQREKR